MGGLGDREGLECLDIAEGLRDEGNDEREALRFAATLPLELMVVIVSVVPVVPLVVGLCIAALVAFDTRYIGGKEYEDMIPLTLGLGQPRKRQRLDPL